MINKIINAFFPQVCPICGKVVAQNERMICNECKNNVAIIKEPKCQKCGKPLFTREKMYCLDCKKRRHLFEKGVAVFEYGGLLRESIYKFKYGNARTNSDYYGKTAAARYRTTFKKWNIDAIIPVPMFHKKEIKRGYNQAQVFAESVSKYTGISLDKKCLIRKRPTIPQKELSDEVRKVNLEGAFAVDASKVSVYRNVLLVDDVYTTGSTIDACAKILVAAGVERVYFLCIAIGRDKNEE